VTTGEAEGREALFPEDWSSGSSFYSFPDALARYYIDLEEDSELD